MLHLTPSLVRHTARKCCNLLTFLLTVAALSGGVNAAWAQPEMSSTELSSEQPADVSPQPTPEAAVEESVGGSGTAGSMQVMQACPRYELGAGINNGTGGLNTPPRLTAPQDQRVTPYVPLQVLVGAGSETICITEQAYDQDSRINARCEPGGAPHPDPVSYVWSCSAGKFRDGNNLVTTLTKRDPDRGVTWVAPETLQAVTITCTIKDDALVNGVYDPGRDDPDVVITVTVNVAVDLDIFNGQNATAEVSGQDITGDKEVTTGAFTVANFNDTDGDGVADNIDTTGVLQSTTGRDEQDLMQLTLRKPAPDLGGNVALRVASGGVKVWTSSTKSAGSQVTLTNNAVSFATTDLPKTLWVEATGASGALRDIVLDMEYSCNGVLVKDTVKATAVWVTQTVVAHDLRSAESLFGNAAANPPVAPDAVWANTPAVTKAPVQDFDGVGLRPVSNAYGVRNVILFKFTVAPAGVGNVSQVKFDLARQVEARTWAQLIPDPFVERLPDRRTFPVKDELVNDDQYDDGESNEPNLNNELFSVDAHGLGTPFAFADNYVARANFREFVRVRFDSVKPAGGTDASPTLEGSRCSPKYDWHSRHYLKAGTFSGKWYRSTLDDPETDTNDIAPGHIVIRTTP